MTSEKLVCYFIFLIAFFEGNYFLSSKQIEVTESALNKTKEVQFENETLLAGGSPSGSVERSSSLPSLISREQTTISSEFRTTGFNSTDVKQSDLTDIFDEVPKGANGTDEMTVNNITIKDCVNISSMNPTCEEQSWNETGKTNYTLVAEAAEALNSQDSTLRVERLTAIAAGVFLVSAVLGYLSCVGYRRFLHFFRSIELSIMADKFLENFITYLRKYGNSQILIPEEVYDTTDLRYFEI